MSDNDAGKPAEEGVSGASPTPNPAPEKGALQDGLQEPKETSGEEGKKSDDKPKKHARAEDRINYLWRQNKEKEALIADKEKKISTLEAELSKTKLVVEPRPRRDQFDTDDAYEAAYENYLDKKLELRLTERDRKRQDDEARRAGEQTWTQFNERARKLEPEDYPDMDRAMMGDGVIYSALSSEFVKTSPVGPQLAYHFYQNPDISEKIAKMPIYEQTQALFDLQKELVQVTESKKTPMAPDPIKPIGSGGGPLPKDVSDPKLSTEEFIRLRREQIKNRRR